MLRNLALGAMLLACSLSPLFAVSSKAEDLLSALASAYQFDPKLLAERARVRAADESLAQARSGYRPKLNAGTDLSWQTTRTEPGSASDGSNVSRSYSLSASQSLFDGFQTDYAASQAKAEIAAAEQDLKAAEQETLLQAAQAFIRVIHARRVVELRRQGVGVLATETEGIKRRVDAGELIVADTDRARARLARANSDRIAAIASLDGELAEFVRVIGHQAGALKVPDLPRHLIAKSLREAEALTLARHPTILASLLRSQGARMAILRIRARLLPQITLDGSLRRTDTPSVGVERSESATVSGRMTIPIYDGGEISSQVRQAKQQLIAALAEVSRQKLTATAALKRSWSQLVATRAEVQAGKTQIEATKSALGGLRKGEVAGQRSPIEVLDAHQELIDAQVSTERAIANSLSAGFELIGAEGQLTAETLNLDTPLYDPKANLRTTEWKAFGLGIGKRDTADEWLADLRE